jgi:hypothetical protein
MSEVSFLGDPRPLERRDHSVTGPSMNPAVTATEGQEAAKREERDSNLGFWI